MMNRCTQCGTTILFGGEKQDGLSFCNEKCLEAGQNALQAQRIPPDVVARALVEVVDGKCPVCGGPGPVDAFTSHRVLSAVVVTSWKSTPRISCRACATKDQLGSALYSFLLGWWGIPWGFIVTPVQIVRNLAGLAQRADPSRPSKLLEAIVRSRLAASQESAPASTQRAAA
jgi:hypothetical protein